MSGLFHHVCSCGFIFFHTSWVAACDLSVMIHFVVALISAFSILNHSSVSLSFCTLLQCACSALFGPRPASLYLDCMSVTSLLWSFALCLAWLINFCTLTHTLSLLGCHSCSLSLLVCLIYEQAHCRAGWHTAGLPVYDECGFITVTGNWALTQKQRRPS